MNGSVLPASHAAKALGLRVTAERDYYVKVREKRSTSCFLSDRCNVVCRVLVDGRFASRLIAGGHWMKKKKKKSRKTERKKEGKK